MLTSKLVNAASQSNASFLQTDMDFEMEPKLIMHVLTRYSQNAAVT